MFLQTKHPRHFHRYFVDKDTNDAICLCGKVKGTKADRGMKDPIPKESKYHNKTSFYNGYGYDSIKEAQYAMVLDDRKKNGLIKDWERQHPIEVYANGKKLFRMKVDFIVYMKDGSKELHETKGYATEVFNLKLKCIEALWLPENPDYSYVLIK